MNEITHLVTWDQDLLNYCRHE